MDTVRIGYVSRVDYENGMISVTFPDRDESVTKLMPYLQFGGEYHMPKVEQRVAVLQISNGGEVGVALGLFWDGTNPPPETGKDVYHKELSHTEGAAFIHHDPDTGILKLRASEIVIETDAGEVAVSDLVTGG